MSRPRRTINGVEYYVLEAGIRWQPGDGFLSQQRGVGFVRYEEDELRTMTLTNHDGWVDLRPVPTTKMVTITYEVTEEYAESQSRAKPGRNENKNRRFAACRKVTEENPKISKIREIRKLIKMSADASIAASREASNQDELVAKYKRDIKHIESQNG